VDDGTKMIEAQGFLAQTNKSPAEGKPHRALRAKTQSVAGQRGYRPKGKESSSGKTLGEGHWMG
jgi:hypothetical protein